MERTPLRTEPLRRVFFTANELIAVGAAITMYRKWLARTPENATEQRETITLLDRFQLRLMQLSSYQLEVRS
jgi:hypothetical protein